MAGVANFYSPAVVNGMLYNIGVPVKILQISQDQDEQGGQEQPQAEAGGASDRVISQIQILLNPLY